MCILSQYCYLDIVDAFLSDVGTSRILIQVIFHIEFRGTTKLQKRETCLYQPFPISPPPSLNLWSKLLGSIAKVAKKC